MLELDYPSDEFIVEFARRHRLAPVDVLRDIARLVAIHQMTVESKFLNDNCVLCGGVAMRFYGSHRFTITDTDASYRLDDWNELNLETALNIEVEDLEIEAGDSAYWDRRTQLTTAQPVNFTEQFSNFRTDPQQRRFITSTAPGSRPIKPRCWSGRRSPTACCRSSATPRSASPATTPTWKRSTISSGPCISATAGTHR
jgi:hypothetical protein